MASDHVTEADFLATIIEYAQVRRWRVAHFRPGMTGRRDKDGKAVWVTPVQADGKGFPDLVCVRGRILYIEAKSGAGKLFEAQVGWRDAIIAAGGEYYCWRPLDWPTIEWVLE